MTFGEGSGLIVNILYRTVSPFGFETLIFHNPVWASKGIEKVQVIRVVELTVTGSPGIIAGELDDHNDTVIGFTKSVPYIVVLTDEPTSPEVGLIEETDGI